MRGTVATAWTAFERDGTDRLLPRSPVALTLLTVLLVLLAASVAGTRVAGLEPLTVLTGSMRPAIDPGDLVLVSRIRARDARPGQVITFRSPDGRDRTVTHRVVTATPRAGQIAFVTRGDANDAPELWSTDAAGRIGRVRAVVPRAGYVARPLSEGWSRAMALGLLTLAGACTALWLIWRPERP